jgi:hypothetical protein
MEAVIDYAEGVRAAREPGARRDARRSEGRAPSRSGANASQLVRDAARPPRHKSRCSDKRRQNMLMSHVMGIAVTSQLCRLETSRSQSSSRYRCRLQDVDGQQQGASPLLGSSVSALMEVKRLG